MLLIRNHTSESDATMLVWVQTGTNRLKTVERKKFRNRRAAVRWIGRYLAQIQRLGWLPWPPIASP
jgi:hypothetical protein